MGHGGVSRRGLAGLTLWFWVCPAPLHRSRVLCCGGWASPAHHGLHGAALGLCDRGKGLLSAGVPLTGPPPYCPVRTGELSEPHLLSFPRPPPSEVGATTTPAPQVRKPGPRPTATSLV